MMKVKRKIIEIDAALCNGCGQCVSACAENAIEIINGKACVVGDIYCDGLGACLGTCPKNALRIIERDAVPFDGQAVSARAHRKNRESKLPEEGLPCGCPSQTAQKLISSPAAKDSQLSNWPVQIRLLPSDAAFLMSTDLLVAADCTPVACPDFHRDFLKGRVVMTGCPKFDDNDAYQNKFAEIFRTCDIKSIIILIMTVPCCRGMPDIVLSAMKQAKINIPVDIVTLSPEGTVKRRIKNAA